MGTLWQDIRYGCRTLVRSPGFTIVAVLSLALGIGAHTAIFSLINGILFKRLPVHRPQELRVVNWASHRLSGGGNFANIGKTKAGQSYSGSFPYPMYCDFRDHAEGFSDIFAFSELGELTVVVNGAASTARGIMVSGNFFAGYGARPLLGRAISSDDDRPDAAPVAVITCRFWERHFGLDPAVVGKTLTLNKTSFTVIAVLPRSYTSPLAGDRADVYVPMAAQPLLKPDCPLASQNHWWAGIMGRLSPGAGAAQAQASLEVLFPRALAASNCTMDRPTILLEDGSRGVLMERQRLVRPVWMLLALVGVVLVIACANLAGMLLARGAARRHEMAVRAALGAGRWRLVRQSLTDSLILSLSAGALGLVLSAWLKAAIVGSLSDFFGEMHFNLRIDRTVLLFALGISVFSALLFGLLPAWRLSRANPVAGLGNARAQGTPHLGTGKILVAAQVALSLLLVAVAGLLVRSFVNLRQAELGFDVENLLVFGLDAEEAGYGEQERMDFYEEVRRSIATLPGVRAVALSQTSLLGGAHSSYSVSIRGRPAPPGQPQMAGMLTISDGFFSTMGIPLLRGRDFNPADTKASTPVMIVNEAFARAFFPQEDPVGQPVKTGQREYQVIGVCADAKYEKVSSGMTPAMYLACRQASMRRACFQVRTVLPPLSLAPAVRRIVAALDLNVPVERVTTQAHLFARSIAVERLCTMLCGALALLAILLVCIGLYGLMAYHVTRRTGEIGIRMALGARAQDVAGPIVWQALWLTGGGIAVGLPAALVAARVMRTVVYGITPYDPITLLGAVALLLAAAFGAAWLPARRAARIDPMVALRCE